MFTIEPCCTQKHWLQLRNKIKDGRTVFFQGYGDFSLADLFPVVMQRYAETDILFVCPALPDRTAELLMKWLRKRWLTTNGRERMDVIHHLTIITDLNTKKSPVASGWLAKNPYPERLTLCNVQQNDTAIFLPDLVIAGNINLVPRGHFTAMVSGDKKFIENLKEAYTAQIASS